MRIQAVMVFGLLLGLLATAAAKPQPFVGTWKLSAVSTKDGPVAKDKLDKGAMVWSFKADGTLDMAVTAGDKTANVSATWTVDGNKLSIIESGKVQVMTFKRKGAQLVLSATGASSVVMTFVPVK